MSMLTFKEKFLALPSDKRAAIWEYCTLYSDSDLPPDMLTERISNIWENAADDPELLAYLEYVDYFCANVDEDECLDGDKRAYLGEYLSAKVDFLPRDSDIPLADLETDSLMDLPTETESLLLECIETRGTKPCLRRTNFLTVLFDILNSPPHAFHNDLVEIYVTVLPPLCVVF